MQTDCIEDVSASRDNVLCLASQFNRLGLSPVHFRDAVLDSINGRYLALRDYLDYQHGGAYAVRLGSGECEDGFCGMTNGRDW